MGQKTICSMIFQKVLDGQWQKLLSELVRWQEQTDSILVQVGIQLRPISGIQNVNCSTWRAVLVFIKCFLLMSSNFKRIFDSQAFWKFDRQSSYCAVQPNAVIGCTGCNCYPIKKSAGQRWTTVSSKEKIYFIYDEQIQPVASLTRGIKEGGWEKREGRKREEERREGGEREEAGVRGS